MDYASLYANIVADIRRDLNLPAAHAPSSPQLRSSGITETSPALEGLPKGWIPTVADSERLGVAKARNGSIHWLSCVPRVDTFMLIPGGLPQHLLDRDRELQEQHRRILDSLAPVMYVLDAAADFALPGNVSDRLRDAVHIAFAAVSDIIVKRRIAIAEYRRWPEDLLPVCRTVDTDDRELLFGGLIEEEFLYWLEVSHRVPSGFSHFPFPKSDGGKKKQKKGKGGKKKAANAGSGKADASAAPSNGATPANNPSASTTAASGASAKTTTSPN